MGTKSLHRMEEVLGDQHTLRGLVSCEDTLPLARLQLYLQGGEKDGPWCSSGLVCDTRQKYRLAPTRLLQKTKNTQEKVQNSTVGL